MNTTTEQVFLDRDNEFALFLLSKGSPLADLSGIGRVVLEIDGKTLDSDSLPAGTIWWDETEEWRPGVLKPVVKFKLGTLADPYTLTAGVQRGGRLITYDIDNLNGIEWTRDLVLDVKE